MKTRHIIFTPTWELADAFIISQGLPQDSSYVCSHKAIADGLLVDIANHPNEQENKNIVYFFDGIEQKFDPDYLAHFITQVRATVSYLNLHGLLAEDLKQSIIQYPTMEEILGINDGRFD